MSGGFGGVSATVLAQARMVGPSGAGHRWKCEIIPLIYIKEVGQEKKSTFFVKKCFNCFLIRERVVIFALDFPTAARKAGNRSSLTERSRAY